MICVGVPLATTCPADRNTTRSHRRSTSTMLWLVTSSAVPSSALISRSPVRTRSATSGSSDAVGSSSTSSAGRCSTALAMPTSVFCPLDSSVPRARVRWPMPNRSSAARAASSGRRSPTSRPNIRRYSPTRIRSGSGR